MLHCYPHALIKGILFEIFKIRPSNFKEVGKEAQSFFVDLFKVHFDYTQFCYELSI